MEKEIYSGPRKETTFRQIMEKIGAELVQDRVYHVPSYNITATMDIVLNDSKEMEGLKMWTREGWKPAYLPQQDVMTITLYGEKKAIASLESVILNQLE